MDAYRDQLEKALESARQDFEKAKKEVAESIMNMELTVMVAYSGAGYLAHIEKVTSAAATYQAFENQLKKYDYMNKEETAQ